MFPVQGLASASLPARQASPACLVSRWPSVLSRGTLLILFGRGGTFLVWSFSFPPTVELYKIARQEAPFFFLKQVPNELLKKTFELGRKQQMF